MQPLFWAVPERCWGEVAAHCCSAMGEWSPATKAVPSCRSGTQPAGPSSPRRALGDSRATPAAASPADVPAGPRGIPWAWLQVPRAGLRRQLRRCVPGMLC